jgi:4-hydroxy-tetrahydrodipicolinate reductase
MDKVTEELQPVVADKIINNNNTQIQIGDVRGVEQLAQGFINGEVFITMYFKAAVGEPRSYDQITIEGTPSFSNLIEGGINGDIATCSIAINCIKSVLKAVPGLHTMADIAVPGQLC